MTVSLDDRITRYQDWLRRAPVSRPMIGLVWEPDIPPLPDFVALCGVGTTLQPAQLDPTFFLPYVERWFERDRELASDIIQPFSPAFGMPWVEAIAGCLLEIHPGSIWARSFLTGYASREPMRFDRNNPWLRKLLEFTHAMVDQAGGRYPVALPQMRGPLDTLAAMRTPQQMSLDLLEQPDEVRAILSELTDLWIGIAGALLEIVPPFHGGYASRMKMWAPGPTITPQNDISTLLSPRMYREVVLPFDRRIVGHFPYHCFHMHASEWHQIDNLLSIPELTAIQLTLEHTLGGPSLDSMLPRVRRILESKPLVLTAMDVETADRCLVELPAAGLCLTIVVAGSEIPEEIASWLSERVAAGASR